MYGFLIEHVATLCCVGCDACLKAYTISKVPNLQYNILCQLQYLQINLRRKCNQINDNCKRLEVYFSCQSIKLKIEVI